MEIWGTAHQTPSDRFSTVFDPAAALLWQFVFNNRHAESSMKNEPNDNDSINKIPCFFFFNRVKRRQIFYIITLMECVLTLVKNGKIIGFGFPVMIGLYFCLFKV